MIAGDFIGLNAILAVQPVSAVPRTVPAQPFQCGLLGRVVAGLKFVGWFHAGCWYRLLSVARTVAQRYRPRSADRTVGR